MRTLEFKVDKQVLAKKPGCDFSRIVAKSVNYLQAKFYFSEPEWEDCRKAASFWIENREYPVLLENDACMIPAEVLIGDSFSVSVTGARRDGYRINTNKFKIRQEVC